MTKLLCLTLETLPPDRNSAAMTFCKTPSKNNPVYVFALCLLAFVLCSLSGCGDGQNSSHDITGDTTASGSGSASGGGGALRFAASTALTTLDPQNAKTLNDIRIIDSLYQPLLDQRSDNLDIEPAVAESVETSEDGLAYTFHLRDDARWSDGKVVTAEDFRYAWRRMLMPDTGGYYANLLFHIDGAEDFYHWREQQLEQFASQRHTNASQAANQLYQQALTRFDQTVGIEVVDSHTLRVRLNHPVPFFEELVAFTPFLPLPEHVVDTYRHVDPTSGRSSIDASYFGDPGRLVTNGPYVLESWRLRDRAVLTQNSEFWDKANMGNTRIVQYVINDPQVALLKYDRGELDWLPDIPTADPIASQLVNNPTRQDVFNPKASGIYYYQFNVRPKLKGKDNPLADPRVRKALSMAIDRKTLVERVTRMNQPVMKTFIPQGILADYDSPTDAGVAYDPDKARRLLAEAGYPGGKGLEGLELMYNTGGGHKLPAQVIRRNWQEQLGVNVGLVAVEWGEHNKRRKQGDYDIARAGWFADYQDPTTYLELFESDNSANLSGYRNSRFDALLDQAHEEPDAQRRLKLLAQAEAIMLADQPVAPIYQYTNLHVFDPQRVHNMHLNPWNVRRLEWVQVGN